MYDELDRLTKEKWLTGATAIPSISVSTTTNGGPINEVQRVLQTVTGGTFTGGTFTLTFNRWATGNLAWNAAASVVQSALEGLAFVGAGNVTVTKLQDISSAQEWQITFIAGKGATNVVQTTLDNTNVTVSVGTKSKVEATDIQSQASGNEVQVVTLRNSTGGTFRLAVEGETTFPIPYNATAAQVDAALEDLNIVDNVAVTGTGPWTVTFQGSQANVNVSQMLADATSLNSGTVSKELTYAYDAASQVTSAGDTATASYAFSYEGERLVVRRADGVGSGELALAIVRVGRIDPGVHARILDIEDCPKIAKGRGRVVLTTVNHRNNCVYDLTVRNGSGGNVKIGVTAFHKVYSADRSTWVSASTLRSPDLQSEADV